MIEPLIIGIAQSIIISSLGKMRRFVSGKKYVDRLSQIIAEVQEHHEACYMFKDRGGKIPFYRDAEVWDYLNQYLLYEDNLTLDELLSRIEQRPNIASTTRQEVYDFYSLYIKKVNADRRLKHLHYDENHKEVILGRLYKLEETDTLILKELSEIKDEIEKFHDRTQPIPYELIDQDLQKKIIQIKNKRYIRNFNFVDKLIPLASQIIEGDYQFATKQRRISSLFYIIHLLILHKYVKEVPNLLKSLKDLDDEGSLFQLAKTYEQYHRDDTEKSNSFSTYIVNNENLLYKSHGFILLCTYDNFNEAKEWLASIDVSFNQLSVDAKILYLQHLIAYDDFEVAIQCIEELDKGILRESPALTYYAGMIYFNSTIQDKSVYEALRSYIPFNADKFPLKITEKTESCLQSALDLIQISYESSKEYKLESLKNLARDYQHWIALINPKTKKKAINRINDLINQSKSAEEILRLFPLAYDFSIIKGKEKLDVIEELIEKENARHRGHSFYANVARFYLITCTDYWAGGNEQLDYLLKHENTLKNTIIPKEISKLKIDILCALERKEEANHILFESVVSEQFNEKEEKQLIAQINISTEEEYIAHAESEYQNSKSNPDLRVLVSLLERSILNDKFLIYAQQLFDNDGSIESAEKLANAFARLRKDEELFSFLEGNPIIIEKSAQLLYQWAVMLFNNGRFAKSLEVIDQLQSNDDLSEELSLLADTLKNNIYIHNGDWEKSITHYGNIWDNKEKASIENLVEMAHFYSVIQPSKVREILIYLTKKEPDNIGLIEMSYHLASHLGFENEDSSNQWLEKMLATAKKQESNAQVFNSLEEFKDIFEAQKKRQEYFSNIYANNEAPLSTLAVIIGKPLTNSHLLNPIINQKASELKRKIQIPPIFAKNRKANIVPNETIVLSTTALLTCGFLDILSGVINYFDEIIVPHSIFPWLLREKKEIAYHQKSRIARTDIIERLIIDNKIETFTIPAYELDINLALEVGNNNSASLLQQVHNSDDQSALLIASQKFKKFIEFKEYKVDISSYRNNIQNCSFLVNALYQKALLSHEIKEKALSFLTSREYDWGNNHLELADDSTIYLDSLSVDYLLTTEVLQNLRESNLTFVIHEDTRDQYTNLRKYSEYISSADNILDNIKHILKQNIDSGKIKFLPKAILQDEEKMNEYNQKDPDMDIFNPLSSYSQIIVDDPWFNQHSFIGKESQGIYFYSSLDLIETLHGSEKITLEEKHRYYLRLREGGFYFIPYSIDEFNYHLDKAIIKQGELTETLELKTIRRNFYTLQNSKFINLQRDHKWLTDLMILITQSIQTQWTLNLSIEEAKARSVWLLQFLNFHEWLCHSDYDIPVEFIENCLSSTIFYLMMIFCEELNSDHQKLTSYLNWIDNEVIEILKYNNRAEFEALVSQIKLSIVQTIDNVLEKYHNEK